MDIEFKNISSIMGFDRYIPILIDKTDDFDYQRLLQQSENLSFELSMINDEAFWDYFLKNYNLIRFIEGGEGNWMKFYQLKPSVKSKLPKELAVVWGSNPQNIQWDEKAEKSILIGHPANGRHKEHIILDGEFKINMGNVFGPVWQKYYINL